MPRLNPNRPKESITAPQVLLLRDRDVARILGCSLNHVWRAVKARKLPQPVRIGRTTRWSYEALKTFIDAGCPESSGRPKPTSPPQEKVTEAAVGTGVESPKV
jgi:predicted DNA-binding transcriptional regulator AlpA